MYALFFICFCQIIQRPRETCLPVRKLLQYRPDGWWVWSESFFCVLFADFFPPVEGSSGDMCVIRRLWGRKVIGSSHVFGNRKMGPPSFLPPPPQCKTRRNFTEFSQWFTIKNQVTNFFPPKVKRRAQNIAFRGQVTRRPPSAPVFHLFSHWIPF